MNQTDIIYDILDVNEKIKTHLIKNLDKTKKMIFDCYTDYDLNYHMDKNKIVDYCVNNGILKKNNYNNIKKEKIDNCNREIQQCLINKKYCKGHYSNYRNKCSSLCEDCQKWTCSCNGFFHCCCYIFEDETSMEY